MNISGGPDDRKFRVPFDMFSKHEKQCQFNHGQTLEDIRRRGGFSAQEAYAVLGNVHWANALGIPDKIAERYVLDQAANYYTNLEETAAGLSRDVDVLVTERESLKDRCLDLAERSAKLEAERDALKEVEKAAREVLRRFDEKRERTEGFTSMPDYAGIFSGVTVLIRVALKALDEGITPEEKMQHLDPIEGQGHVR